ncbi:LOW QUALITY PROTEIN: hypothetical protein KUTeg_019251 [Tegillarca granosa]|uniref:Uncharacterized protein n=1 Tax=Tegillarca granosa TaxID=220873 RepID=A0ABQ9ECG0_TEGGR|nr:LOW QUALITY PROTEIN: hypothetical protein KUTeg_019251 [Tegillarca granosa]
MTNIDSDMDLGERLKRRKELFFFRKMMKDTLSHQRSTCGEGHPRSFCRRYISVCSAFLGIISTALLVALIGKYMEQSRMERYLFNFVSRVQKSARRKKAAAEVIKNT